LRYKSDWRYDTLAGLEKGENQMTKKADALLKIPSEVPSGKDVPFQDITVMSFSEAKALDDITLGAHVFTLGSEFVKRAGSAIKFVQIHRSAIQELRKRYSTQGRRSPVPGCPSWGEFVTSVFKVSQQYMNSLLVSPYPKQLGAKKPAARKPTIVTVTAEKVDEVANPQAVAASATRLARMVEASPKVDAATKRLASAIVAAQKDDPSPFLPTVANVNSNMTTCIRIWNEALDADIPDAEKEAQVARFVRQLSDQHRKWVENALAAGKEKEEVAAPAATLASALDTTLAACGKGLEDSRAQAVEAAANDVISRLAGDDAVLSQAEVDKIKVASARANAMLEVIGPDPAVDAAQESLQLFLTSNQQGNLRYKAAQRLRNAAIRAINRASFSDTYLCKSCGWSGWQGMCYSPAKAVDGYPGIYHPCPKCGKPSVRLTVAQEKASHAHINADYAALAAKGYATTTGGASLSSAS
jgi:hypothetical protein